MLNDCNTHIEQPKLNSKHIIENNLIPLGTIRRKVFHSTLPWAHLAGHKSSGRNSSHFLPEIGRLHTDIQEWQRKLSNTVKRESFSLKKKQHYMQCNTTQLRSQKKTISFKKGHSSFSVDTVRSLPSCGHQEMPTEKRFHPWLEYAIQVWRLMPSHQKEIHGGSNSRIERSRNQWL